jgi:hypothetical protein
MKQKHFIQKEPITQEMLEQMAQARGVKLYQVEDSANYRDANNIRDYRNRIIMKHLRRKIKKRIERERHLQSIKQATEFARENYSHALYEDSWYKVRNEVRKVIRQAFNIALCYGQVKPR